jgi:hypothetical protein
MTPVFILFTLFQIVFLAVHIALFLWHRRRCASFQQETVALAVQAAERKMRQTRGFML